jgi:RNA-directed DNA polymerase
LKLPIVTTATETPSSPSSFTTTTTTPHMSPTLCNNQDLEDAFEWLCDLRVDYSPNSDIWNLRRDWKTLKPKILHQLNHGSYTFSPLTIYTFNDGVMISLWSSEDMLALKIITNALSRHMGKQIPASCYHVKDHGGLKKAVDDTYGAIPKYTHVFRTDVKSYYDSIDFTILMSIIRPHVQDPILLDLILKACHRTESNGGIFTAYEDKGVPMGSLCKVMSSVRHK